MSNQTEGYKSMIQNVMSQLTPIFITIEDLKSMLLGDSLAKRCLAFFFHLLLGGVRERTTQCS
jgi:hypothetical protein